MGGPLWATDGTSAGTWEITSNGFGPNYLTPFGGEMLFEGLDANSHPAIWVTNGTSAGTSELSFTTHGLDPLDLTVLGNEVLFNGGVAGHSNLG